MHINCQQKFGHLIPKIVKYSKFFLKLMFCFFKKVRSYPALMISTSAKIQNLLTKVFFAN